MEAATSDVVWLQRMLDVEAAIARAEAAVGLIPAEAAAAIAAACDAGGFDVARLGREAVPAGGPVVPLVRALTAAVPAEAAAYVHWGATTQDVMDSAMMLIVRDGLDLVAADLDRVADACAGLAERHRGTVMAGRTLLQQALPITFGLKAAGWLVAAIDARRRLGEVRSGRLAVQFGGAAGTLAALGPHGLEVARALGVELRLAEPALPWHTARGRVVEVAMVLGLASGTVRKIALDVALLSQTEVGEVAEPSAPGRGGSSAMPQKRNPVGAIMVEACARGVEAQVGVLLAAMGQAHERSAGAWQSEWPALSEALRLTSGAVARITEVLEGLEVDEERMRRNVEMGGGVLLAEGMMMALAERVGRPRAQELVRAAALSGRPFREALLADPAIAAHLGPADVDAALDPDRYLGSADALVDRALAEYEVERSRRA
jgi:3-carboxy-cis,cis-muconate cycloisomerase